MVIHYINKSGLASTVDAPVTNNALHKATLMKEDYIKLSFVDVVDYEFPSGSYVTFEGMNYYLAKDYVPTMKDEATYSYDLQFNAPWYNLDTYMFFYNTLNDEMQITRRESEWYITDTAANILNLLIKNTQDPDRVCPCRLDSVFYCEGTPVKTFTFSNTSVLGALNNLAKDFELEWWVEYSDNKFYLHFGECDSSIVMENGSVVFNQNGERVKDPNEQTEIVAGQDVTAPKISQKKDLKKYYYVYGSSRNIDQTVEFVGDGATVVTSIVTKRLPMLNNPQTKTEGTGEEVVIFDDIYPRSDWMVTHVESETIQSEEIDGYDEDGNPHYKTYKVYNLRLGNQSNPNAFSDKIFEFINDPTHTPSVQCIEDCIASGKILSLKFIIKTIESTTYTPKLAGFEFELGAFLNTNINQTKFPNKPADYQWYEFQIIKQDINGYIIPNDTLIPEIGDWICLFNLKGWVVEEVNEGSTGAAQQELQEAFNKYYNNLKRDISYSVKPYIDESWIYFGLGKAVTLKYGERTVVSRISAFEKKLYHPQEATYTISAYNQPSTVNQLQEEVKIINANIANGQAFQLDGNAAMDILTTYGKNLFLSKTQDDSAAGEITFLKGLTSQGIAKLLQGTVADKIGTPVFVDGFTGEGWRIDSDGNLTLENLTVRSTMRVFELLVQQVKATGGEIIVSPANGKIKAVTEEEGGGTGGFPLAFPVTFPQVQGDMYVCTIDDGENESGSFSYGNMFKVGDWVRCQRWNKTLNTIHSYWVCVAKIDGNDIYLPKNQFTQGNAPEVGDELVLMGSASDTTRQGVISISATDDGHPRITVLNGINSPNLSGCTRLVLGDLSGITDPDFTGDNEVSGYGLYSDNVFLKGKIAMSDGTLISKELTEIKSGKIHLSGETTVDNDFYVRNLETIPTTGNARVSIKGSLMEVYGTQNLAVPNIRFGVDEITGSAVMQYYDNYGVLIYDLGPNGINFRVVIRAANFTTHHYVSAAGSGDDGYHQTGAGATGFYIYSFSAKRYDNRITGDDTYVSDPDVASFADGKYLTTDSAPIAYTTSGSTITLTNAVTRGKCHPVNQPVHSINDDIRGIALEEAITTQAELTEFVEQTIGTNSYNTTAGGITVRQNLLLANDIYYQKCSFFSNGVKNDVLDTWQ